MTLNPIRTSYLKVFCVWKKPEVTKLITDENEAVGGTWYWHQIHTNVRTDIMTGVSRTRPIMDSNGIPHLQFPEGALVAPLDFSNDHQIEITPLLPGNPYFFVAIVIDAFGNWEVKQATFTTLRRKLTVEFPTLHIFNDGDIGDPGEAEFWFRVYFGSRRAPRVIEEFHLPLMNIDDWSETDRPYSLGFAHVGLPQTVNPGQETISVQSWAREDDDWPNPDEHAQGDRVLLLPTGRLSETVIKSSFLMDCPTTSGKFHYGVDVRWSVEYMT